ncbi:MAG: PDZ domain-containing protein [Desulfobacteraceae bacterium]|nr:PDZ domain-containing protein [Desulfobacteraceae bacterium]
MKKYFILSNIILIGIAIFFSVKGSYKIMTTQMEENNVPEPAAKEVSISENQPNRPQSHYRTISQRNLFKTQEENIKRDKVEPEPEQEEIKDTELKLALWGTISGDINKAIIEDKKERKQNLYREGDSIQIATIKKIYREKVILSVNGKDEILKMEEKKGKSKRTRGPSKRTAARGMPGMPNEPSKQNIKLDRSEIEKAVSDVTKLMKEVRIRPHFKNGKPDGLSVSRIRPNSIFSKLGLRSGDVISGVDGDPIESVDDALKFYKSLKNSSSVSLEIKRRGRPKNIEYNIE